ncbi:hypothetical protein C8J56DRAFT_976073 [Mycena floridula]|nr:hypothetical protein C8J56DRAFT_976073 [Mycena floridula]
MTPEETLLLKHAGQILVRDFASAAVRTFCYGVYVLLALLAMYCLLLKHNKTTATWALCALLTVIFLIATASFCLDVAIGFKLMIGVLIESTELELFERLDIANASTTQINMAQLWLNDGFNSLLLIFGDGIVVWRAWAIWHGQRSVIILPGLTLLASFALFLAHNILQPMTFINPLSFYLNVGTLDIAGVTMSIMTNLIAITLIGLKTYQHWKFMKDIIGPGGSAAGKVLMFLTESGIVYIGFQAIYPSLVILIVTNQHSISHITHGSTGVAGGYRNPGTHISFAHPASQGTTNSTEDQTEAAVQSMIEVHHDIEKVSEAQEMKDLV